MRFWMYDPTIHTEGFKLSNALLLSAELCKYAGTIGLGERGGAEHPWAPQTDLQSILIRRMAPRPEIQYPWKQIFGFTSTKSLLLEKSQHDHKVFNGT